MVAQRYKWPLGLAIGIPALALGLLLMGAIALWVATQTQSGRDQLRDWIVGAANGELPGRLKVHRLKRIDLEGIAIEGLLLVDPSGGNVLSVDRVQVALGELEAWRSGRVVLPRVVLDGLDVQLSDMGKGHGLLAALPQGPAADAEGDRETPPVEMFGIEALEIRGASMAVRLAEGRPLVVSELNGALSLEVDLSSPQAAVDLNLQSLSAQVALADQPELKIVELRGRWQACPLGELSFSSGLVLEEAEFQVQMSAAVPAGAELEQASFQVRLDTPGFPTQLLQGLSGVQGVDQLIGPGFASARGAVEVSVTAEGTFERFTTQGRVNSRVGRLVFDGARAGSDLSGHVRLEGLELGGGFRVPLARALAVDPKTLSGAMSAEGRLSLTEGQLRTEGGLRGRGLRMGPLRVQHLRAELAANGTWPDPQVRLTVRGRDVDFDVHTVNKVHASVRGTANRARVSVALTSVASGLSAKLDGHFVLPSKGRSWTGRLGRARVHGKVAAEGLDAGWLAKRLQFHALPALEGTLQGMARFNGTQARPQFTLTLGAHLRSQPSRPWIDLSSEIEMNRTALAITGRVRDPSGLWAIGSGRLERPVGGWLGKRGWAAAKYQAKLSQRTRSVDDLPVDVSGFVPYLAELQGLRYGAEGSVEHAPGQEPEVQVSVHARLPSGFIARHGALATSSCGRGLVNGVLAGGLELTLSEGSLLGRLALTRDGHQALSAEVGAELRLRSWLAGRGEIELDKDQLKVSLERSSLVDWPVLCRYAEGTVVGELNGSGLLSDTPDVAGELRLDDVKLAGARLGRVRVESRVTGGRWTGQAELEHGTQKSRLSADVPLKILGHRVGLDFEGQSSLELELNQLPVSLLTVPGGAVSQTSGDLSGRLTARGPLLKPALSGWLSPKRVGFTWTALAQPIRSLSGRLNVANNRLEIAKLRAEDGQGWVELAGDVNLQSELSAFLGEGAGVRANLRVRARDFPLRSHGQVVGTLNTQAKVRAELAKTGSRVEIELDKTTAFLSGGEHRTGMSLQPHGDVIDPRVPRRAADQTGTAPKRSMRLHLATKEPLWVRRDDFAALLQADVVAASPRDGRLAVRGEVQLLRGYMDLLGVTFDIDAKSKIEFVGSAGVNPALSISGRHQNRRTGAVIEVRISGRANDPQLEFSVDGASVSVGDAALAVFGNDPAVEAETSQEQAQSFVTGVVAGLMAVSARRELGEAVPILMVDTAQGGKAGRIRAGFDLDSWVPSFLRDVIRGVYVEGVVSKDAQASCSEVNEQGGDCSGTAGAAGGIQGGVLIELFWPHNLISSGRYGPGESWSLDLDWSP